MIDLNKLLDKAADSFEKKNFTAASSLYREILKVNPDFAKARVALRITQSKMVEEKPVSSLSLKASYLSALVRIFVGSKLFKNRSMVVDVCESYLYHDPNNINIRLALGTALFEGGIMDGAAVELEGVMAYDPVNIRSARMLAEIYKKKEEVKKGLECVQTVLRYDPQDKEMQSLQKDFLAIMTMKQGKWQEAGSSQDLVKNKDQTQRLAQEGFTALSEDQVELQIKPLRDKVDANPDDPDNARTLKKMGDMYAKWNRFQQALSCLQRAAQLDKTDPGIKNRIGDIRMRMYDHKIEELMKQISFSDDAACGERIDSLKKEKMAFFIDETRRRVKEHPTDLKLHFVLGKALYGYGVLFKSTAGLEEAIAELQLSLKDPQKKAESCVLLGHAFGKKLMDELSAEQFEKCLQSSPSDELYLESYYSLGVIYTKLGLKDKAKLSFSKVIEKDNKYLDASELLKSL